MIRSLAGSYAHVRICASIWDTVQYQTKSDRPRQLGRVSRTHQIVLDHGDNQSWIPFQHLDRQIEVANGVAPGWDEQCGDVMSRHGGREQEAHKIGGYN